MSILTQIQEYKQTFQGTQEDFLKLIEERFDTVVNPTGSGAISDGDLKKLIELGIISITPSDEKLITQEQIIKHINCSTIDLTLAPKLLRYRAPQGGVIDSKSSINYEFDEIEFGEEGVIIYPGEFYLGRTQEVLSIPGFIDSALHTRSSIGRLGLIMHTTAGFIDGGFSGSITLEIASHNRFPVKIYPGQRVIQAHFQFLSSVPDTPYNKKKDSKYMNQIEPTPSLSHKDSLN